MEKFLAMIQCNTRNGLNHGLEGTQELVIQFIRFPGRGGINHSQYPGRDKLRGLGLGLLLIGELGA